MKIGYARVSTFDQKLDLQLDALKAAGCEKVFQEKASGAKEDRPELTKLLSHVREGDTVVIWRLDRLARSLKHLIQLVNQLESQGVAFSSVSENIDTSTAGGRLIFHIFGALAEFERNLIRERTNAGLKAARERGRVGGRKKGLSSEAKQKAMLAEMYYKEGKMSTTEIAESLGIARGTLYKYLKHRGLEFNR